MKIYLARHGESVYNVRQLCNDDPQVDVPLTEQGMAQAKELAETLRDIPIDQIFTSELPRTQVTAEIVNQNHHAPVQVDARLGDIHNGFEGQPHAEYAAALEAADDKWSVHLNGGESLLDVRARVQDFLDDLRSQDHKVVLIVTSQAIIKAMYGLIADLPDAQVLALPVPPASYLELNV